jgi:hypothetical protein
VCSKEFYDNIGTIVDDQGALTDDQTLSVLLYLLDLHVKH